MSDVSPEFQSPEAIFHKLGRQLFHNGRYEPDGHYLDIPTDSFGSAQLTDYMSFQHIAYDKDEPLQSLDWILAAGSPILSLQFSKSALSFVLVDPRFVRPNNTIRKQFLAQACVALGSDAILRPSDNAHSIVYLHIGKQTVLPADPATTPHIQEVVANLHQAA